MASVPQYRRRLGENIRTQRKQIGLSQEKLAEKAELHPVYVGRVERGEENVSIDSLMRIAKALKATIHDLVGVGPSTHEPIVLSNTAKASLTACTYWLAPTAPVVSGGAYLRLNEPLGPENPFPTPSIPVMPGAALSTGAAGALKDGWFCATLSASGPGAGRTLA